MKCLCKVCGVEFEANPRWHHKTGVCGNVCRAAQRRIIKSEYKKTEKGRLSEKRWRLNPIKKAIDKRSRQKPRAKRLAVIRSMRTLANNVHLQVRKRERDKLFSRSPRGRAVNLQSSARYRKTPNGRAVRKISKARRRTAVGSFTVDEWLAKCAEYKNRCASCRRAAPLTVDHIIPVTNGGNSFIENIQPLCQPCNSSKGAKLEDQMRLRM